MTQAYFRLILLFATATRGTGGKKFRLHLAEDQISRNPADIEEANFWANFDHENPLTGAEFEVNEEVSLGARIARCDLILAKGKARICIDLQEAELLAP